MIMYDWECEYCGYIFEKLVESDVDIISCLSCGEDCRKVIIKPRGVELKYNPKTDICDWNGNTSQYYRKYNEAKDRGENVRLPEKGE
jgi:putative FmdB family regulatory protein